MEINEIVDKFKKNKYALPALALGAGLGILALLNKGKGNSSDNYFPIEDTEKEPNINPIDGSSVPSPDVLPELPNYDEIFRDIDSRFDDLINRPPIDYNQNDESRNDYNIPDIPYEFQQLPEYDFPAPSYEIPDYDYNSEIDNFFEPSEPTRDKIIRDSDFNRNVERPIKALKNRQKSAKPVASNKPRKIKGIKDNRNKVSPKITPKNKPKSLPKITPKIRPKVTPKIKGSVTPKIKPKRNK